MHMAVIQYFLPGNPCLYYGDEAGVYGFKDPHNRKTYPWGREDEELIKFFQMLGKIRKDNAFLKDASFVPVIFHGGICTFARQSITDDERLLVGVNLSDKPFDMEFLGADDVLYNSGPAKTKKLVPNSSIILK
jgi:glycosidase